MDGMAIVQAIGQMFEQQDTAAVIKYTEELELDMAHTMLELAASCAVYKAQLVAYLIARDLDAARFLWKRLPAASKAADAELASLWAIGKAMWTGDRTGALVACEAGWSAPIAPAVAALREQLRAHLLALVGRGACAVSLADCGAMLRLADAEMLEVARRHGWGVGADGTLAPKPLDQLGVQQHDLGMGQLQQLTRLVAQLD